MSADIFDDFDALLTGTVAQDADTAVLEEVAEERGAGPEIDRAVGWSQLDEATRALRRNTLGVVTGEWLAGAAGDFLAGRFNRGVLHDLGSIGALGTGIVDSDRPGRDKTATFAVMHSLEYAGGGLRCAITIQDSVLQALTRFGSDAQKEQWIGPLMRGEAIACFGLTEPDAGSDVRSLQTHAVRREGDWVLNGQKGWLTNAPSADVLLVWARSTDHHNEIRGYLVDPNAPGVKIEQVTNNAGMRTAPVGLVHLDGVRVPADAVLPHAWGLADINACLDHNRMTVAFGVMGAARFCLEKSIEFACARQQFGAPLGIKQLVQQRIADMACAVVTGEQLALRLAEEWQRRPLTRFEVSLVKRANCSAALDVARQARAVLGSRGLDLDNHVIRHLLNLEASYTYGGTHEIHGLVIGKTLTGLDAF